MPEPERTRTPEQTAAWAKVEEDRRLNGSQPYGDRARRPWRGS